MAATAAAAVLELRLSLIVNGKLIEAGERVNWPSGRLAQVAVATRVRGAPLPGPEWLPMTAGRPDPPAASPRPAGVTALCLFFAFGVCACVSAGALLLFPGSALDAVWRINPRGHAGFLRMGPWAVLLLAAVAFTCAVAAIGLRRNTAWGHRVALGILAVNLAGDLANALGGDARSLIGVPIALALIVYLWRRLRLRLAARPAGA
jgi:hypothetical protein